MRTDENSKFTLHRTETQDWYSADEVDTRIVILEGEKALLQDKTSPDTRRKAIYTAEDDREPVWFHCWAGLLEGAYAIIEYQDGRITDCGPCELQFSEWEIVAETVLSDK